MPRRLCLVVALFICLAATRTAHAQGDSARAQSAAGITHMLRLRDGSTLMGKLASPNEADVEEAARATERSHGRRIAMGLVVLAMVAKQHVDANVDG